MAELVCYMRDGKETGSVRTKWERRLLSAMLGAVLLMYLSVSAALAQMGQQPISPWTYQAMLGCGMDVDWAKTAQGIRCYSSQAPQDFTQAGLKHVRIRVKDDADTTMLDHLERIVQDCLDCGLIPILAYQADCFKKNPDEANLEKVVSWWRTVAQRFRDVSYLVAFDVMIECTDALNKQPDRLNALFERTVAAIRESNPERIVMISPRMRSDPLYLHELEIPAAHNGYLMAEWHFYAAGPSKINPKKQWTTGTQQERQLILDKIRAACEWQGGTGIPTWVGAWMPGNYNDGNEYTVQEQCAFASFVVSALRAEGIPFAVNSDTKFYDREMNAWNESLQPVLRVILGE